MTLFSIFPIEDSSKQAGSGIEHKNVVEIGDKWAVSFDPARVSQHDSERWVFLWYGEYNTEPDFGRVRDLLASGHVSELWGNRGVVVAIDKVAQQAYVLNDSYGAFPVYFSTNHQGSGPLVCNSLPKFKGAGIDWASFYQFLSLGYVFGDYSLYQGVSRLNANACLVIDFDNTEPSISCRQLKNFWNPEPCNVGEAVDDLVDILRKESEGFDQNIQIMMSGGWDSRLLLSALEKNRPTLFTHGNLHSREIGIVRDIASTCDLPLVEQSISDIDFGPDQFSRYLKNNDSAMFTHWSAAGRHADSHNLVMTAGTFGEVLGGHYGTLNTLPGKKKYASLLMHVLGVGGYFDNLLGLKSPEVVLNYLNMKSYGVFWLLDERRATELSSSNLVEESNRRLKGVFTNYEQQGMDNAQAMFERFYTEHRGGQYINLQLTNAAQRNRYRNVFTNRDLVETVSKVPFGYRAHNKLNKALIKRMHSALLDYPMAATLANARRPLLVQEGSRALRKLVESNSRFYGFYKKHARYGDRKFGWNNFQDVVDAGWIEALAPLMGPGLWDRTKIVSAIKPDNTGNRYPLFDMISKAITLDYMLAEHKCG